MRFIWLFSLVIGVWGTGINITEGNEGDFSIPLQIAVCVLFLCLFLERTIREGR